MEKWIIENMRDCLKHGYNFKWFIESREYYLDKYSIEDLKDTWDKQVNILSRA